MHIAMQSNSHIKYYLLLHYKLTDLTVSSHIILTLCDISSIIYIVCNIYKKIKAFPSIFFFLENNAIL